MRYIVAFLALLVAALSCVAGGSSTVERVPQLGTKVKNQWVRRNEVGLCQTALAQLDDCFKYTFDGVTYSVAYNKHKRVVYLFTADDKFRTADGLKVGDEITISEKTAEGMPGYEIWAPTTSDGWRPIIGFNEVKLKDETILNYHWPGTHDGESTSGIAKILGFSKNYRKR